MASENRFQIVFDKLSEVAAEQRPAEGSETQNKVFREASDEIAELRRAVLEIIEPPVSLFTTT